MFFYFLFLGTILVDTVNTSPEAGKTTPYDREMLGRLMSLIQNLDTKKLYDDIQQAKNDVSGNYSQAIEYVHIQAKLAHVKFM